MHMKKALLVLVALLALVACTSPHALPEAPTPIPRLAPATLPAGKVSPVEENTTASAPAGDGDAAAGEAIYQANCLVCHNLTDQQKVGPGLKGLFDRATLPNGEAFSETALRTWITNGGGAMPGVALSDPQLDALVAYLQGATQ